VLTIVFYFIMNLYFLLGMIVLGNEKLRTWWFDNDYDESYFALTLKFLCFSQGLYVPFLRLSEPYFYSVVLDKTYRFCCPKRARKRDEDARATSSIMTTSGIDDDEEGESAAMAPLFFFLASSLNTELVYIILKSVTQFSNFLNDFDSEDKRKKMAKI